MEMCYDGALVMPSNCVLMEDEEMTYVEGGSIVINRTTIKKALCNVWSMVGSMSTAAWLAGVEAKAIGAKIASSALSVAKAILSVGGFAGFALQAIACAIVGFVAAAALTIGIVYVTNSTMVIPF